ncbi:MAG: carboxypeptidase-like regulatory domain-containing protein [Chitinophagaceae bacterium]|nr:carboxypeptidase-like regulatory domain-containing protein [Chitinophagaceae bacterium]MCB9046409.1 carboxypeptidase-like regulatory domain-containing protein [Chitinophagales bacterium]
MLLATGLLLANSSFAQNEEEKIVQINGVTMTADSLRAVPGAVIMLKNNYRGTISNELGVFSIVAHKGDTLVFTELGFRPKEFIIPHEIDGHYFSMVQLMTQDTFYLQETIIRPYPTREEFNYAFKYWDVPDDRYERARKNTEALMLRALAYTIPKDGGENQSAYQNIQAQKAVYYGQQPPSNWFNPLAWAEFYEAWKRGDFKKRKY